MRIVFVTKFLPLPADSGGKQRSLAVLRRLAEVGDVTLVALDDGRADHAALRDLGVTVRAVQPPGRIGRLLGAARARSLSAGRFHTAEFSRTLHDVVSAAPVDLLHVNYAQLAPHGMRLPARRRVLDLHNIESALMTSYSTSRRGVASAVASFEAAALRRIERGAAKRYDAFLVVSTVDRDRLLAHPATVLVCPNGWELGETLPPAEGPPIAVFVALLGWAPNVDAARWLVTEIWPHVRRRVPGVQLRLVGRDPSPAVTALATDDVVVTGEVPSIAPELAAATVALAPLRSGGGSRLKVLEALDAGRPVVATTVGIEGLEDLVGEGVVVADEPAEFAAAVSRLLTDSATASQRGRAGHDAVHRRYAWDATLRPLFDWLSST